MVNAFSSEVAPWAADEGSIMQGRKSSVATVGMGDDFFTRHVRENDPAYAHARNKWAYVKPPRMNAPPPAPSAGKRAEGAWIPPEPEFWRNDQNGTFKLDWGTVTPRRSSSLHNRSRVDVIEPVSSDDPSKPLQRRLNIMHLADATCTGSPNGGPSVIVHKHSKAVAFSIFRDDGLLENNSHRTKREQRNQLDAHFSILLAPRSVQEQYTSTKSTKSLNAHGLLDEKSSESSSRGRGNAPPSSRDRPPPVPSIGRQIIPSSRVSRDTRPSTAESQASSTHGRTDSTTSEHSGEGRSSSATHDDRTTVTSATTAPRTQPSDAEDEYEDDDDDLNGPVAPRTSHAEAFGSLDRVTMEQYRQHNPPSPDTPPSILALFRKPFKGSSSSSTPRSPNAHMKPYAPAWVTMAPRHQQDSQDEVIHNLNESFKDVGLLPSNRRKGGPDPSKQKRVKRTETMQRIPDDVIYMLLPLWSRGIDPKQLSHPEAKQASQVSMDDYNVPPEQERVYLYVSYRPFDGPRDDASGLSKKRSRSTAAGSERADPATRNRDLLNSFTGPRGFQVSARRISYAQLSGTGMRIPAQGLVVTGSPEDLGTAPSPEGSDSAQIIAWCEKREKGVLFVDDGLEKLGLCRPREQHFPSVYGLNRVDPAMQVNAPDPEQLKAEIEPLTPLGRAVHEMVWLGCMAITSFGTGMHAPEAKRK